MKKLKCLFKEIVTKLCKKNIYVMQSHILDHKVLSLDIFDTAVKRNVKNPEHIFEIVQSQCNQSELSISDFSSKRKEAENKARLVHKEREEIELEEIYSEIANLSKEQSKIVMGMEKRTELAFVTTNHYVKRIYDAAIAAEKKVIFASDMYLPVDLIEDILNKCGYRKYERLYLSSERKKCKHTGSLYEDILNDYNYLSPSDIIHVGDSLKADYIRPKQKGINAILIDNNSNSLRYWNSISNQKTSNLQYSILQSFIINTTNEGTEASHIGYEVVGPLIWGYCKFLNQRIKEEKPDKIFFLSREGLLLQKAYNLCFPKEKINQDYLYVSRRALIVPMIKMAKSYDEIVDLTKGLLMDPTLVSLAEICSINLDEFVLFLRQHKINENKALYSVGNDEKPHIYKAIMDLGGVFFSEQNRHIYKYLIDRDFRGKTLVCDIGWSGSIQHALSYYLGDDAEISGCYIGVRGNVYPNEPKSGFLFDKQKNTDFVTVERLTASVFETLFLNTEGSVIKYKETDMGIVPILAESEYDTITSDIIKEIHNCALDFVRNISKLEYEQIKNIDERILFEPYKKMSLHPTKSTINLFSKVSFLNGEVRSITPHKSLMFYLFHPLHFRREFKRSNCKAFFLESLVGGCFPIYEVMNYMINHFGWQSDFEKNYKNIQF